MKSTNCSARLPVLCVTLLMLPFHPLHAQAPAAIQVFDTGTLSATPFQAGSFASRSNWFQVPEDNTKHLFKGDAVIFNGKLALVLRWAGAGGELYSLTPKAVVFRATLVARATTPARSMFSLKLLENNPAAAALEVTFRTSAGKSFALAYELKPGQSFVQTQARSGANALRILAPCRFGVLPDFFADDFVVDATELPLAETELPSENFFMHMLAEGQAIVMPIWHPASGDVRIGVTGRGQSRLIANSEVSYAPGGKIWICVLEGPDIWHWRNIAKQDADNILRLKWKPPFAAHWRVDWERDDHLTDSWEMLTQKPNGEYVKHGWYGQPESFGNEDWLQEGRKRWTTVLGFFQYPCWIDNKDAAFLQPLKRPVRFLGPALIYPITRLEATPLDQFTIVDLMRATLGVGPCEYILDVEGQKKTYRGRPTCLTRELLNNIYSNRQQKAKRDEVLKSLDEVIAFVRHIRGRIENYLAFGRETVAWLEEQKQSNPELVGVLIPLQVTTSQMERYLQERKEGIKTPEYATQLVKDFRSNYVDYDGRDAFARCKNFTAALVDIGGHQDELVGECRMVVKILRQRAAIAAANDPRLAPIAKEIRRRTQQILRNPVSYEAPRH